MIQNHDSGEYELKNDFQMVNIGTLTLEHEEEINQNILCNKFWIDTIENGQYSKKNEQINDSLGIPFSSWIKKKHRMNVTSWEPNNALYPRYMLLGTDKGILAYIEFFFHSSKEVVASDIATRYGICHELEGLKRRIGLVDSDLDRPVFYIHVLDYVNFKGIFFETTEMVKNNIFEKRALILNQEKMEYYFSDIREMGSLDELISIFEDLKRNNVKFY